MTTSEQRKADIIKIIKTYLLFRPNSTSRDILNWLNEHDYGLNRRLTTQKITKLIIGKSNESLCHWFNVEMIRTPGKPVRWRVVE